MPRSFAPCCDDFGGHLATCALDVRYEWWAKRRAWVIAIAESAGGGGIEIRFCPHCGAGLARDARNPGRRKVARRPVEP